MKAITLNTNVELVCTCGDELEIVTARQANGLTEITVRPCRGCMEETKAAYSEPQEPKSLIYQREDFYAD